VAPPAPEPEPQRAEPEPQPAAPEPAVAEAAPARGSHPSEVPPDDNLPSLDDLEAALASVSKPPPPPAGAEPGDIPITEGAPAVAHTAGQPEPEPVPPAPHDMDGLELPSWDEAGPTPLLSEQAERRATIDLEIPGEPEDGLSEVLEAADDDLDLDSLPLSIRSRATPARELPTTGALFEGLADQERPRPTPTPAASPSRPELPVVGGVVPDNVDAALRDALAAKAGGTGIDEEAPTTVMSDEEAAAMAASFPQQDGARPSLADLPPPPDMPAPIPPSAPDDKKKSGLFGKIFGRKKK
jgi:hypothetical protein